VTRQDFKAHREREKERVTKLAEKRRQEEERKK